MIIVLFSSSSSSDSTSVGEASCIAVFDDISDVEGVGVRVSGESGGGDGVGGLVESGED